MGQAREVMDRLTTAMEEKDKETLAGCYAANAVAYTPDQGELQGRDAITGYLFEFWEAMPDVRYEHTARHESGDVAIDEGTIIATNTGPLRLSPGETLQPTGKQLRIRSCDVARVENGEITSHHFYFDQVEFLSQLGLMPELSTH
ncbi:ester cyclase [Arthrobacter sp. ISL-72]|uniref:ester cyclase n=1 Tax=Arthrobacter sp. ISL-72 TaxID=2819114 RepID=UPI001BEC091B|nr:nuclear transport factor 2 family protein [Arthrobacter sp. ISL-72]MBT2596202.1 nuclear transport factor 2 family protein [Arthrobacter sp. ISL-72]